MRRAHPPLGSVDMSVDTQRAHSTLELVGSSERINEELILSIFTAFGAVSNFHIQVVKRTTHTIRATVEFFHRSDEYNIYYSALIA